ncbi:transcription factor ORG2-like [Humulus lupulus]|uniref:transcription factor ORG2-like n=1 Tax=Humulus lupulus TaxID=3486 RepID=UPI002B4034D4|nr:transcription factor ORG2-like [Humulus lupulus]
MLALYASSQSMALLEDHRRAIDHFTDSFTFYDQNIDIQSLLHQPPPSTTAVTGDDPTIVKKLCHNASERERRKKLNSLYASLRSLLPPPPADRLMKKLSNPSTISRTIMYIPELQNQVKGLIQKKEELLSCISRRSVELIYEERHKKSSSAYWRTLSNVSASRLNERELVLQISSFKVQQTPLSHILVDLEEDGFPVLNATSFESFGGRVFYNIHLQVEKTYKMGANNSNGNFLSS